MKPTEFAGQNVIFAKDQPQYLPLPAHRDKDGMVTSCWQLSFIERLQVFFSGKVWLRQLTFNNPLQPIKVSTESFDYYNPNTRSGENDYDDRMGSNAC